MNPWEQDWSSKPSKPTAANPWEQDWGGSEVADEPKPYRPAQDSQAASNDIAAAKRTATLSGLAKQLAVPEDVVYSALDKANNETLSWAERNPSKKDGSNSLFQTKFQQYLEEGALKHNLDTSGFLETAKRTQLSDIPAMLGSGSASLASGAGELFRSQTLIDAGKSAKDYYDPMYSDAMKNELSPTAGVVKSVGESLPGTVAGMAAGVGIGGLVGKVAAPMLGSATSAATAVPTTIAQLAKVAALHTVPRIAGGALGEGSISALSGAEQAASEFDAAVKGNRAAVLSTPRAQALLQENGGDADAALQAMRGEAINQSARNQGIATTIGGLLVPGIDARLIGKAIGSTERMTAKGVTDKLLNVGRETGQEFIQGYGEQVGGNLAAQNTYDPKRDTTEGALLNASMSGIAGTVMAGAPEVVTSISERAAEGLKAARQITFSDPSSPASQAGITPVTVPINPNPQAAAPNVSTPSAPTGVPAGAVDGGGNIPSAGVANTRRVTADGSGVGDTAGTTVAGGAEGQSVSPAGAQQDSALAPANSAQAATENVANTPISSTKPVARTADSALLSRIPQDTGVANETALPDTQVSGDGAQTGERSSGTDAATGVPAVSGSNSEKALRENAQRAIDLERENYLSRVAPADRDAVAANTPVIRLGEVDQKLKPETDRIKEAVSGFYSVDPSRVQFFSDQSPDAPNGFTRDGVAWINTKGVTVDATHTAGHEGHHVLEQIAKLDDEAQAKQGASWVQTPAQKYRDKTHSIFGAMSIKGQKRYADQFLYKAELDAQDAEMRKQGKTEPEILLSRQQRVVARLSRPETKSEMVADFAGNRFSDPVFLKSLHDADKTGFSKLVSDWSKILKDLVAELRGQKGKNRESEAIDGYVKGFEDQVAKFRDALIELKKGGVQGLEPAIVGLSPVTQEAYKRKAEPSSADKQSGVYGEVAPDPRNVPAKAAWDKLTNEDKSGITKDVMDGIFAKVAKEMGLGKGWSIDYTTGMYEGGVNPSGFIKAPAGTTAKELSEVGRVIGYILDQKGMVAFDESNTTSASQAAFVKVVLPSGMEQSRIDQIRQAVFKAVPQAEGDTLRDGSLVFGNFSAFNEKGFTQLDDEMFADAIEVALKNEPENIEVYEPRKFHSEWIQPSWDAEYSPTARDGFLEGTRYASDKTQVPAGGDGVRGSAGGNVPAWLEQLKLSTDRKIGKSVEYYGANPTAKRGGRSDENSSPADSAGAVEYGFATEGSVSAIGVHFSQQKRGNLSSAMHGSGKQGADNKRLDLPQNKDIKPRIHFYVSNGTGVHPEEGVGSHRHKVKLNNLYDVKADRLGIVKNAKGADSVERISNIERQVMRAGFDGYLANKDSGHQDFAVLVGKHDIPMYKRRTKSVDEFTFDEDTSGDLGNFNLDANQEEDPKIKARIAAENEDFDFPDLSNADRKLEKQAAKQAELDAEFRAKMVAKAKTRSSRNPASVTVEEMKAHGLFPEKAFPMGGVTEDNGNITIDVPDGYNELRYYEVTEHRKGKWKPSTDRTFTDNGYAMSKDAAIAFIKNQGAAPLIHKSGFDIASAYRKGTVLKLAQQWRAMSKKTGMFKLPNSAKSKDFEAIVKEMGALKEWKISVQATGREDLVQFSDGSTTRHASIRSIGNNEFQCCTLGLAGSNIGSSFYAVTGEWARLNGKKFKADGTLSSVNTARRTEQSLSFGLKTGDTGVMMPGVQNRVYGYNENPVTPEDHDMNIGRLLLAGLRNAVEIDPAVRNLRYDPNTDAFTTKNGEDASAQVDAFLQNIDARAYGMGRTTLARAVMTGQIIAGDFDSSMVDEFKIPVAYKRKVGMDEPVSEEWGEPGSAVPKLKKYLGRSVMVHDDGTPIVMYHGTARDISEFKAKQAGAIFLTYNPDFADDFSAASQSWMAKNAKDELSEKDYEAAKEEAIKVVMADKYTSMTERKQMAQDIRDDKAQGAAKDALDEAATKRLPTGPNIMPLVVRAEQPFDYRNKKNRDELIAQMFANAKDGTGATLKVWGDGSEALLFKNRGTMSSTEGMLDEGLKDGDWTLIEEPETQQAIRDLGHDSFFVKENGQINLAVYDRNQVKSAIGNNGNYDINDNRIAYKRKQTDTPEFKRWFGDSKVVDADGKPLVVYHYTENDFNIFDTTRRAIGGEGSYFSTYKPSADGGRVVEAYLSLKNPKVITHRQNDDVLKAQFIEQGYDGVIMLNANGKIKTAVAFYPNQIKSATNNNGNFDGTNPDIRYKRKQPAAQGLPEESQGQKIQRVFQDKYNRVKLIQDLLLDKGGVVGEEQDVYRAEERMHGRVHENLREFADEVVHPLIDKAVKMGVDLNELATYAYAKHATERNAHIQKTNQHVKTGSGMSDDEAANIIQLVEQSGDAAAFDELHNDLLAITATTRRLMLDEGLITQDQYDGLEKQYENYVPLRGFEDVDPDSGSVRPGLGRGFQTKGAETIKAMGRDSKAGDIIENIIRDYERITIRAERNAVGKTFLDLVTSNPDPKLWEVQPMTRATRKVNGLVEYVDVPDKGDETISVKVAGEQVYIKINDPLLLRAMQNTFKAETSDAERFLTNTVGRYTSLLRNTITRYNPAFGVINAVRDSQMGAAGVFDELGAEGLKRYTMNYGPAIMASGRVEFGRHKTQTHQMDKWMREMRFAGGTTGGVFMRDHETIQKELRDAMLQAGATPEGIIEGVRASKAWWAATKVMHGLELAGSMSENAARLAAYATAREMGKTPAQAASIAKNLTVNFNRFGEQGQLINTMFLFFNASVQGSVRIAQMLKNKKVQAAMAGVASAGFALAMWAATGGGDDEDGQAYWDKIPDFEKERNIIIMLPPGSDQGAKVGTHGRYIKIPMAYGLNIFPVLGYQLADLARNIKDPARGVSATKAAINLFSAVAGSYNPMGGSFDPRDKTQLALAVSPTIVDAGIQLYSGVNGFGQKLGPEKSTFDKGPDAENVSAANHGRVEHRIARWLNEHTGGNQARSGAIDLEPGTIKNLQGIVGGGLGKFVGDILNLGYLGAMDAPIKDKDIPVWKSFYGEYDQKAGMSQFYERSKKARDEFDVMQSEAKKGIKKDYTAEDKFLQSMGAYAQELGKAMGELKKWEVEVAESKRTEKEKEFIRRDIQKKREAMAEKFNSTWYAKESKLKRGG